jgi:hypothetical protein
MDEEEDDENDIEEFKKLVKQSEHVWKPAREELELINVSTEHDKKELKIRMLITIELKSELVALLREYVDIFAWSYADMPGLDAEIVVHRLSLIEGCRSVKQKLRRTRPDVLLKVKRRDNKTVGCWVLGGSRIF